MNVIFASCMLGLAGVMAGGMSSAAIAADDLNSPVLERIKERGIINIGHREASVPFSYIGPDGEPIGYTMDICAKIVEQIEERTGVEKIEVNLVPVTSQTRIALIANGTVDMECGSTTNNLTRQKQVDYLHVTFLTGTKVGSLKGSGITEIEDLDGKRLALSLGTTNEKAIRAIMAEKGLNIDIVPAKDHPQAWLAVETGRVDAYATDAALLFGLISKSKEPSKFQVTGRYLTYDPYGIMVPRNDSEFRLLGNTVISDLMRSGELRELYAKWFEPGPTNINMPITDRLKTAFEIQSFPY